MSLGEKNVKKYENLSKNRKILQNISKNHPKIAKYCKKCQKMSTFILPNRHNRYILTPQSSFLTQNPLSFRKKIPKKCSFFIFSGFSKSRNRFRIGQILVSIMVSIWGLFFKCPTCFTPFDKIRTDKIRDSDV